MKEFSDEQIKAIIFHKLRNRNCWGARYTPLDTLVNWRSKRIRRDGKRVRSMVRELANEGYLLLHKKGSTVSLNPVRSKEIIEFITSVEKME